MPSIKSFDFLLYRVCDRLQRTIINKADRGMVDFDYCFHIRGFLFVRKPLLKWKMDAFFMRRSGTASYMERRMFLMFAGLDGSASPTVTMISFASPFSVRTVVFNPLIFPAYNPPKCMMRSYPVKALTFLSLILFPQIPTL